MKFNVNPTTGVPYGYISAAALDPDVVHELLYGAGASDLSALDAEEIATEDASIAASELGLQPGTDDYEDYIERAVSEAMEDFQCEEPLIHGNYDGVEYRTSWLGGALNFFIFFSPVTTDKARAASPCVPGAAILDTLDGSTFGYDVPADWRAAAGVEYTVLDDDSEGL